MCIRDRDTIVPGLNGRFFQQQTAAALAVAIAAERTEHYDARAIRRYAEGFSTERFLSRIRAVLEAG